ncbi:GNAT family N-acetyltransferase [Arenimonas composti]|uniref:BioF2-like acetyltransferase domain-containing protein n=1 Tax=Arenimonas composti TR7-09 = DSM 18010 TaxID=1121013 RepID=A0A091BKC7_9GAMM|nr:GNAT family N-acetyltransferase [Arenimonas composti]KFN51264.1 hypothetical protein P873_03085 [Arenimonas composti TR7-09 = DSM 18010]
MTSAWEISTKPGEAYLQWVSARHHAFAEPGWTRALAAIGAQPLFAWSATLESGVLVACMRRGPFRLGICGHPVAGPRWDAMSDTEAKTQAESLCAAAKLDLLRLNRSMLTSVDNRASGARMEFWIDDLAEWRDDASRRRRKDLAFARRATAGRAQLSEGLDPSAAFALYAATVDRHAGNRRYTPAYFVALQDLARESAALRCLSVTDAGGGLLGFAVLAFHGRVAYYLHGGASPEGRRAGVSDLLLEAMLVATRDSGCRRFSLMASPWDQPGLSAFKEKWSDRRGFAVTHDLAASVVGRLACGWLRHKGRGDRRLAVENAGTAAR